MQLPTRFLGKPFSSLLVALLLPLLATAQTGDPMFDRMEQMMRRMQEQMRQGFSFDTTFEGGRIQFFSPDSNSTFFFRMDTSFQRMGDGFFDMSPFGGQGGSDFFGFDQFFNDFFNGRDPFMPRGRNYGELPADDGNQPGDGDDLLPEERLRLQEEQGQPDKSVKPKPEKASPGSKVKTIRI